MYKNATKRTAAVLLTALLLLLLCACGATESSQIITSGKTSAGTPIVDHQASDFSVSDVPMQDTPNSSCFSEIGYSAAHQILVVTFRESGSTYLYLDVPQSEWESFRSADSLGKYYNAYIKYSYSCNKY